ncbi:MAG: insulinase family protein [Actinomycetota bacterium]|nr:MAG: insulinase family protein [Actinomycetota bacterium]
MSGYFPATQQRPGSTRTLLREPDGGVVRRTVLPGGLRVVTEQVPGVRSVTFGIWVGVGSRDETARQAGSAHYLEHLLFKGTSRRSALDISSALDAVGGEMNAFTAKEYTCFYARVLDADLPLAVDVVSDMITSALIDPVEVDNERGVILEEISMHDDDPADVVHDEFTAAVMGPASPLGRPILGTVDTITSITRSAINAFYRKHYRPANLVVSAAGSLDHATVVRLVRKAFNAVSALDSDAAPARPRLAGRARPRRRPAVHLLPRRTEQANLVLGVPGLVRTDDRRFALGVLNAALGGGMSSRLFQEVREKRGLAYSVYSFTSHYADDGIFGVYAGCQPRKIDEVLSLCREQLATVAASGIHEAELARGKGQLRGSLVLGLEDTGSRMSRIAKAELLYDDLPGVDDTLRRIDAVSLDDVRQVATDLLAAAPTLAVIGPFDDATDFGTAVA